MDLKNTSTPRASGLPIGSATGPENGDRIPRVMVLFVTSTPTPALMPPELLLPVLAQPDSTTRTVTRVSTHAENNFLIVMCSPPHVGADLSARRFRAKLVGWLHAIAFGSAEPRANSLALYLARGPIYRGPLGPDAGRSVISAGSPPSSPCVLNRRVSSCFRRTSPIRPPGSKSRNTTIRRP